MKPNAEWTVEELLQGALENPDKRHLLTGLAFERYHPELRYILHFRHIVRDAFHVILATRRLSERMLDLINGVAGKRGRGRPAKERVEYSYEDVVGISIMEVLTKATGETKPYTLARVALDEGLKHGLIKVANRKVAERLVRLWKGRVEK